MFQCCSDVSVCASSPTKVPADKDSASSRRRPGSLGQASRRRLRLPCTPRVSHHPSDIHSTTTTTTTHSLATTTATTAHHLSTTPERATLTSIISAAVQTGQRLQQAQSKSRACTTPSPQGEHIATNWSSRTGLEGSAVIARASIALSIFSAE